MVSVWRWFCGPCALVTDTVIVSMYANWDNEKNEISKHYEEKVQNFNWHEKKLLIGETG